MTGISSGDSPFFCFWVVIITKVNMIKSQELVNFQGARPNGFLRVTFIYRKQANVHEYKKVRLIYDQ